MRAILHCSVLNENLPNNNECCRSTQALSVLCFRTALGKGAREWVAALAALVHACMSTLLSCNPRQTRRIPAGPPACAACRSDGRDSRHATLVRPIIGDSVRREPCMRSPRISYTPTPLSYCTIRECHTTPSAHSTCRHAASVALALG